MMGLIGVWMMYLKGGQKAGRGSSADVGKIVNQTEIIYQKTNKLNKLCSFLTVSQVFSSSNTDTSDCI